jgi:hypothetical protein
MISHETMSAAIQDGIVTAEQARRLYELERAREASGAEPIDDERLRFISGFGDIFVTMGLLLFLGAAGYFLFVAGSGLGLWLGMVPLTWVLAEFFSRIRRMALPSIVLLIVFAVSVFSLALVLLTGLGTPWGSFNPADGVLPLIVAGLATAGAAALHYWRFAVPITVAAGVAALALTVISVLAGTFADFTKNNIDLLALGLGILIFLLAMRFDLSDPERVTRRTDIAFWLHLLAAPLIVHPLVSGMLGGTNLPDAGSAIGILAIFMALGVVAVLVDRRALLVSGLAYAGFAFASLLKHSGLAQGTTTPATMLALGAFVLLLSAGWRPLRSAFLAILPRALATQLPPATGSHT